MGTLKAVFRLSIVSSLTAMLSAVLPSTATAAGNAPQPNICVRSCWGAVAPNKTISQMSALTRAIVHHTADSTFNTSGLEASKANMRSIQAYHRNTNGWGDIGYHFLIDKFGNIFEGRQGSMTSLPRGAHDAANTNSFGFTLMGYFHPNVNNVPTAAMLNSLYNVIAWRMPNGWTPYGSPGGTYGNLGNNVGRLDAHRRVVATACPGDLVYGPYMGSNINAGPMRDEINARIVGVQTINPPFTFDSNNQGWTQGNGVTGIAHTNVGWPGIIYTDQVGNDGFIYSPPTNFTGSANQLIHVRVYPQSGTTANHEMKAYWTTAASTGWDETKSSSLVTYTAQNAWFDVFLGLNQHWTGQNIRQIRLDFDGVNSGTRWIVDTVEVVNIDQPPWTFDSNTEGWSAGNSISGFTYTNSGWPGIIYGDQTGNDANYYSPRCYFTGGAGDWVKVRVFPQSGTTANHDMQIFFSNTQDPYMTAAKSSAIVNYTAQNVWTDVYLQVGNNAAWNGKTITQVRLDFDQANSGTRWIVDSVTISGPPPTPPAAPSGLAATAVSNSQINLSWADNSSNENNFVVARSTTSGGPYTDIATVGANTTSYNNSGLSSNTAYYYVVRATNAGGTSANSAQASATTLNNPPAAPSGLGATSPNTTTVNLSWTDNSNDETNFVVARSTTSGGPYTDIVTLGANATSYSNGGLAANTTYYYVVRATNAVGSSANSAQASATTWPNEMVIDNSSSGFTASANWSTGTSAGDKYGADYRFRPTAAISDTANWNVTIPQTRNWDIYAWWAAGTNRSPAAPYHLTDNSTAPRNQQVNGGTWNLLGTKSVPAGAATVKLSCWAPTGYVVLADAVRFVPK